ncbi:MAG TPA: GDSL-type esterase/lipase family protein [Treponemataceae bacterium]|nr:GDSL-type esterase/lipase family protein [Treponemataceae bacterium]
MKNIAPSDPSLRYTGRMDFTNSDAPTLINAGSSIHARFSGTSVGFRAINHHNYFENSMGFLVDGIEGKAVLRNDSEPHDYPIASGLADGTHELILWKRSDGGLSYADFLGLLVDDGAKVTSAGERPTRRIECFGDSVSAGEVAEALAWTGKKDPELHDGKWSNSWHSYVFQTARALGAEVHNNSQGGIAVLAGSGFFENGAVGLESTWDKLRYTPTLGKITKWDFSSWTPHVVIMALGQNDKHPEDYIDTDPKRRRHWQNSYAAIIRALRGKYPKALFVIITTLLEHPKEWDIAIDEMTESLADPKVVRFKFTRNGTGTPGHLRIGEHAEMAYELTGFLRGFGDSIWE